MRIRSEQHDQLARSSVGVYLAEDLAKVTKAASFDGESGVLSVTGYRGQTAALWLDADGRVVRHVTPLGRVADLEYDDHRLIQITAPGASTVRLSYDDKGLLSVKERDDGAREAYRFDRGGRLSEITLGDESCLRVEYDGAGRPLRVIDRDGSTIERTYGADGRLALITDPMGRTTRLSYGAANAPERIEYPDGTIESYDFGPGGCVQSIDGQRHGTYRFDGGGRLTEASYEDGQWMRLAYDDHGRVLEGASPDATVACDYDDRGRIVADVQEGRAVRYTYDAEGNLSTLTLPDGQSMGFEYDPDGRVSAVRDWKGGVQRFEYADGEQPVSRRLPNGLIERYRTGPSGQFDHIEVTSQSVTTLWSHENRRDRLDRIAIQRDSRFGERSIHYDTAGRVLGVVDRGSNTTLESFSYDRGGDRVEGLAAPVTYDVMYRPQSDGLFSYGYDALGNRVLRTGPRGDTEYRYARNNLLTRVRMPDGTVIEYAYDAFGRRVRKRCGQTTTVYVWAGLQIVQEIIEKAGEISTCEYLYWPGRTGRPLATQREGTVYYYHCDALGTPQLLSGGDGEIAWSARYHAFGAALVEIESVTQPLRFRGQYHDGESGLYYNVARYYDPRLGVYLTRDPAGPVAGLNPYQYADGDPVNVVDPLGLFGESWPSWVKTTVSVVGAVAVGVAVGAAIIAAAPALGIAAGIGLTAAAIVGAGVAGGAVGGGLSAAMTAGGCVPCAILRGALLGGFGSLFFVAALPFELGVLGMMGVGAVAGAATYTADWATSNKPWNTGDFLLSVGLGATFGGLGKWVAGKFVSGEEPPPTPRPDPATVEATGKPTTVWTGDPNGPSPRAGEKPYHNPPDIQTTGPGKPAPVLDPKKGTYLWQVGSDGEVQVAPENQGDFGANDANPDGRPVKHGDLNPAPDGQTRGVNRAGGELVPEVGPDGEPTGNWTMNNSSSNTFQRQDGTVSNADNLRAAKQLMGQHGMDTSGFQLQDYDGNPVSE